MMASATKIANFNVIELADASGRDAIIGSPLSWLLPRSLAAAA
jgi:hypothetical protein